MSTDHVKAEIAFVTETWRHSPEPPRIFSRASRETSTAPREVTIRNARLRDDLHLDRSGFVLVNHRSDVTDFRHKPTVLEAYFPEMKRLLLDLTGAADAFPITFYQVRSRDPEHFFDAYSLYMHCDFSPGTWTRFAQHVIRESGVDRSYAPDEWDYAAYNLWRPVGGTVERDPLVLIDASTVDRSDIIDYLAVEHGDKGKAAVPLYNKRQRFFYVPDMRTDEVLIFKQLDSRPTHALVCPHTSFVDPTAPPDARPRESIDIRFVCVFEKGTIDTTG